MGRVLALVAGALVLFIAGLGLAVYVTRDEDNIQGDSLLSEAITQRVAEAPEYDDVLDLPALADFEWDRVLLVQAGTSRDAISKRLGREWTGIDTVDGGDLLIFLRGADVMRFANYRGRGRFEGFERPFAEIPRAEAVLPVHALVIRPAT